MAEQTKQALIVENNTNFPNNNTGYITPALLREFNTDMIDSTVNQIGYTLDSASFDSRIDALDLSGSNSSITALNEFTASATISINALNAFTSSVVPTSTGSLLTTASFSGNTMTFTKGDGSTFGVVIPDVSGSVTTALNQATASLQAFTASVAGTNTFTQSAQLEINALEIFTASVAGTNAFTESTNARLNSIEATTASLQSQINLISGSGTAIAVDALNAFTASIQQTNAFTASAKLEFAALEAFTASVAGTNAFTQSAQNSLNSLNAATSSYITSAVTASMSVASASFAATASLARNVVISAINDNQSTLSAGTVVRITGATGDNPRFNSASWDNDSTSANTLGILGGSTATGAYGEIVTLGSVIGVNTDPALGYAAGQVLYLGPNGTFTNVQPQAPQHIVTLGEVLRAQQNNGSMFVNISNGWELNELHNVRITSAAQGDLLVYEASSSLWKNQTSSSFAKTNQANTFLADQIVSGSMTVTGNLEVFGSASFTTVTSSVIIGGNTIILNTFTPSVRYGGIEVIDSGSTGLTGSLLWDSQNDVWVYVNPSGSSYASARLISGPKSLTLGSEPTLTQNRIPKADDGDHIVDSQISDDGTTVRVTNELSASTFTGLGNLTSYSSSVDSRINGIVVPSLTALNAFSASTNTFTQSADQRLDSIEALSGSWVTSAITASSVVSIASTLADLQFSYVLGNGTSQTVTLLGPAGTDITALNAFTASVAGTNAFTASTITSLNALNTFTASIAGTNAFTASATQRLNSLESTSASVNTSLASLNTFSASALTTASFSGNTLTFTKGNGTTFGVIIPDVSGSTINTGSFATTGSNSFFGNQTISGSVGISGSAITFVSGTLSGSVVTNIGDTYTDVAPVNRIITLTSASYAALASGSTTDPNTLYIVSGSTSGSIPGAALTGNNTFSGSNVYTGSVQGNVVALSISSNTASMDFNAGNFFTITLASGSIPTFINPTNIKAGQTVSLVVTQASTLSGSLAFPTTFKFPSGSSYVPSAVTSSKDIVTFITVDTSTIYASSVKNLI